MDKIYTFSDLENIQSFIISLKRKANKLGIKLEIDNKNKDVHISDEIQVPGYFTEKIGKIPGIIAAATRSSITSWLPTLVHESCHMDQWDEKIDLWNKSIKFNANDKIDKWLEGKNYTKQTIKKAIQITRDLELDCEKRSVDKIKKYNLPIDIKQYIQISNVYIFFHNWVSIKRRWYNPKNDPFTNPKIYNLMESEWYDDYTEMPPQLLKAFKKYKI